MLPCISRAVLSDYQVYIPSDTGFRAAARLLQALWRLDHQLPIGSYRSRDGQTYQLGSLLATAAGANGGNFLTREISAIVATRLPLIGRLASNLLSSHPLVFNLLAPLARAPPHATNFISELCSMYTHNSELFFEFKPSTTRVTYDCFIEYATGENKSGFIEIECKYSESLNPLPQLKRQYQAAQDLIKIGQYNEGCLLFIGPEGNRHMQHAAQTLTRDLGQQAGVQFIHTTLEEAIAVIGLCKPDDAALLHERYTDYGKLER